MGQGKLDQLWGSGVTSHPRHLPAPPPPMWGGSLPGLRCALQSCPQGRGEKTPPGGIGFGVVPGLVPACGSSYGVGGFGGDGSQVFLVLREVLDWCVCVGGVGPRGWGEGAGPGADGGEVIAGPCAGGGGGGGRSQLAPAGTGGGGNHCSSSPKMWLWRRFMLSKSKAAPTMRR